MSFNISETKVVDIMSLQGGNVNFHEIGPDIGAEIGTDHVLKLKNHEMKFKMIAIHCDDDPDKLSYALTGHESWSTAFCWTVIENGLVAWETCYDTFDEFCSSTQRFELEAKSGDGSTMNSNVYISGKFPEHPMVTYGKGYLHVDTRDQLAGLLTLMPFKMGEHSEFIIHEE